MTPPEIVEVLIGLGSNLGDSPELLRRARVRLAAGGRVVLMACSPLYRTEPWGKPDQPWFLNQVCRGYTSLSLHELLAYVQAVERELGRRREEEKPWGPRPIDVDILAYGALVYRDHLVEVPHPRLHLRRFVLVPLVDVAPAWRHPRLGKTAVALLAECPDTGRVERYVP